MTLNHRREGSGPPLLLVHGFGISFNIWERLRPLLGAHFQLVMVELPGIGDSPRPAPGSDYLEASVEGIEELRRALRIERWAVLGYSSGTRVAEAYVSAHAARVSAAIFLCPLLIGIYKAGCLGLALRLDGLAPAAGDWVLSGWRLRWLISWLAFNLRRDARRADWYAEIGAAPRPVLKDTLRAAAPMARGDLAVQAPYARIWADRDLVPARPRRPGAHDYFVHGRHAAPVESAEEIAELIVSFLEGDEADGASA